MIRRRKASVLTQTISIDTSFAHFLPELLVYIDVPRGLVLFDQTGAFLPDPALVQYDRDSKTITSVAGAHTDDTVCNVSRDMGEFGEVRSANILFNESGGHLCLPLPETARCNWAEDLVIDSHTGAVEYAIQR
ncbi:hypothetical protein [Burkholderia cepacia]|uniref:hypothetical protein n=1 Tax=Burkholderia cepacia TaxID=292 RepID=UPI002FE00C3F